MEQINRNILRKEVLAKRDLMPIHEREDKSISINSHLMNMPYVTSAKGVFVYMHFRSEVQTSMVINQMLSAKQTVTIPYTRPDTSQLVAVKVTDPAQQVVPGYCGIPEPRKELVEHGAQDPAILDLAIIPGSVFDRHGGRLGYGGGYYDRFLTAEAPEAIRIGLAFELQIVDRVPVEAHDQFMDFVITEKQLYDCRRNRYAQNSSLPR